MFRVNRCPHARAHSALRPFYSGSAAFRAGQRHAAHRPRSANPFPSSKGGVANLEAKTQSRKGDLTTADGDVDIHYGDSRLRADHVEYNIKTYEAPPAATFFSITVRAPRSEEAHYNVSTGHGLFHNVRGTIKIERRPNPALLLSIIRSTSKLATLNASR